MTPGELAAHATAAVDALEHGKTMPASTRDWLLAGLRALLNGYSLRAGFGLPSQQGKPAETRVRNERRNRGIRELLLAIDPTGEHPTAAAREAARLLAGDGPGPDDAGGDRSGNISGADDLLLELRQAGPLSARQIARIANDDRVEPPAGETINRLVCLLSSK